MRIKISFLIMPFLLGHIFYQTSQAHAEVICNANYHKTNIRKGPSAKNYSTIYSANNGHRVQVLEQLTNEEGYEYFKIKYTDSKAGKQMIGYVYHKYISKACEGVNNSKSNAYLTREVKKEKLTRGKLLPFKNTMSIKRFWHGKWIGKCRIKRDIGLFENSFKKHIFRKGIVVRKERVTIDKIFSHPNFKCSKTSLFSGIATLRFVYSYTFKGKKEFNYVKVYGEMKNGIFHGPITFNRSNSSFSSSGRLSYTSRFLVQQYTEMSGSKLTKLSNYGIWPAPWGSESKWKLSLKAKVALIEKQKKQADLIIEMEGPFQGLKRIEINPTLYIEAQTKVVGPPSDPYNKTCSSWYCLTKGTSKEVFIPFEMHVKLKEKHRDAIKRTKQKIQVGLRPTFLVTYIKNGKKKTEVKSYPFKKGSLYHGNSMKAYELSPNNNYSVVIRHEARVPILLSLTNGVNLETHDVKGTIVKNFNAYAGKRAKKNYAN